MKKKPFSFKRRVTSYNLPKCVYIARTSSRLVCVVFVGVYFHKFSSKKFVGEGLSACFLVGSLPKSVWYPLLNIPAWLWNWV